MTDEEISEARMREINRLRGVVREQRAEIERLTVELSRALLEIDGKDDEITKNKE
jgi:hypothetical protein